MEGLEARLAKLTEGIVDIPTAEGAVERAQVSLSHTGFIVYSYLNYYCGDLSVADNTAALCPIS